MSSNFKNKVYLNALKLGLIFLSLAVGSSFLGKYLDRRYDAYPKYSLITFAISFIVSWVIVIIVLKKSKFDQGTKKQNEDVQHKSSNTH